MSYTVLGLLYDARCRISDFEQWTRGFNARDKDDFPCDADSPFAASWCSIGSVALSARKGGHSESEMADCLTYLAQAMQELSPGGIFDAVGSEKFNSRDMVTAFNDALHGRSEADHHWRVLGAFDRAKQLAYENA